MSPAAGQVETEQVALGDGDDRGERSGSLDGREQAELGDDGDQFIADARLDVVVRSFRISLRKLEDFDLRCRHSVYYLMGERSRVGTELRSPIK